MFPQTYADYFALGALTFSAFFFLCIFALKEHYKRQDKKEIKERREAAEKERQAANIATIYDLTKDIWNDVKSFKLHRE